MRLKITPSTLSGQVAAPPSKSYTHRAVIAASLAAGDSVIASPLLSDDTNHTIEACRALGAEIERRGDSLAVKGNGGKISLKKSEIYAGNSGSTVRLIAPLTALSPTVVILDGDDRLRQRPMDDLLSALVSLGVKARSLNGNGCPPIEIQGGGFKTNMVTISGAVSSQPLSGLLLAAPLTPKGLLIEVDGELRSRPYIDITLEVMRAFGVAAANRGYKDFVAEGGQSYQARQYPIEGDYSSAAYFLAAGAVGSGPLTVTNLKKDSAQGDRHFLAILTEMGASVEAQSGSVTVSRDKELKSINVDLGDHPDLVPTLAVVAAFSVGKTTMSNIGHLRFKESDRISDTAAELARMGVKTEVGGDSLAIYGGRPRGAEVNAHNDHRLAMSLAVAALFAQDDSTINGAEAVTKSYPHFFDELRKLGARVEELP